MSDIKDLSKEITKALEKYSGEVSEGLEEAKKEVAKKAVAKLKKVQFGTNRRRSTGKYSRGWRVKKVGDAQIVYNKTSYQLTHLLEYGHAKKNGGRVSAIPHIRPVNEQVIKQFTREVEKVIRK